MVQWTRAIKKGIKLRTIIETTAEEVDDPCRITFMSVSCINMRLLLSYLLILSYIQAEAAIL